jgi:micrococcal nuclease
MILPAAILALSLSCQSSDDTNVEGTLEKNQLNARVIRVIDGDTLEVHLNNGKTDKVRLLGVDTPETNAKNKPGEYGTITDMECLTKWGQKATSYAIEQLDHREVILVLDEEAGLRGYYGRLLAYVEVDKKDFNRSLVQLGYARVYEEGESQRESEYLKDQSVAQANSNGLWSC